MTEIYLHIVARMTDLLYGRLNLGSGGRQGGRLQIGTGISEHLLEVTPSCGDDGSSVGGDSAPAVVLSLTVHPFDGSAEYASEALSHRFSTSRVQLVGCVVRLKIEPARKPAHRSDTTGAFPYNP